MSASISGSAAFSAGGSEPRSYDELSLGTRRVLHLIVSLILDRSSLMLVEHPEDSIHRGLMRKLMPTQASSRADHRESRTAC
jgi:predicted ATPase